MRNIIFLIVLSSFIFSPVLGFAQIEVSAKSEENKAESKKDKKNEVRVQFLPKNKRDPFLSRDEVANIEKARRAEIERIAREKKAKEEALIAARKAEEDQIAREAYLKANPHLAIVGKIKIQGMMGDEVQINNDFKGVGNKVAGATITKITGTRIFFKYKGKDFSLPIPKQKD